MSEKGTFRSLEVVSAPMYKWDGSGGEGDDIYLSVKNDGGATFTFVLESDLFNKDTDLYKAVKSLEVGDMVSIDAYVYFYSNAPQCQIFGLYKIAE